MSSRSRNVIENTISRMKTFENTSKMELIKKLKKHQKADAFVQGNWLTSEKVEGNGFRGCFYGCTMQTREDPIKKFSEMYQIDIWYCHLTEHLFENLPDGEYQKLPLQSIQVLPNGFDMNKIKSPFFYKLLMDPKHGQINYAKGNVVKEAAIKQCADLFIVDFEDINEAAANAAMAAAEAAAEAAGSSAWSARSAAMAAAEAAGSSAWSARSATWSAAKAAGSAWAAAESAAKAALDDRLAAGSAVWSADWSDAEAAAKAARAGHYIWMRDVLFSIIREQV